jgi:histidine triad (HIT) family protein
MNNGEDAGQEVFHAHMHVVPRFKDDEAFEPVNRSEYSDGQAKELAEKIKREF